MDHVQSVQQPHTVKNTSNISILLIYSISGKLRRHSRPRHHLQLCLLQQLHWSPTFIHAHWFMRDEGKMIVRMLS